MTVYESGPILNEWRDCPACDGRPSRIYVYDYPGPGTARAYCSPCRRQFGPGPAVPTLNVTMTNAERAEALLDAVDAAHERKRHMTDPLFIAMPGSRGPLRTLLDNRLAELAGQGHELAADLVLVVASLADRIDDANAGRVYRGFVMLTAEYRAARRDLLEGLDDGGADPLEAALAEFRAAEEQHPTRLEPPY